MPAKVRKAVFPAAGLGTRFLPATKAAPKEMLPIVDKPVVQYAVETDCARYDCGDKVGFLHANIAVGLQRPDIIPALRAPLKDFGIR